MIRVYDVIITYMDGVKEQVTAIDHRVADGVLTVTDSSAPGVVEHSGYPLANIRKWRKTARRTENSE